MNGNLILNRIWLAPLSLLYGAGVAIRNWLFNGGVLPSEKFNVPVLCVGNITMGGTGKTPFSEYLIRLLQPKHRVGFLSRGYKRKSKGYILANANSLPSEIGDEPCQVKNKFPDVVVAVNVDRREGIRNMLQIQDAPPDVIILDDAYQYRYVEPDVAILLIDYNRLIVEDYLFPLGWLREPASAKKRAHIVVITKCPRDIKPIDIRVINKRLNLYPYQTIYFTTLKYDEPVPVFATHAQPIPFDELAKNGTILALSGIASPLPFEQALSLLSHEVIPIRFPDHHYFSENDFKRIEKRFYEIPNPQKVIVTTEKDAVRIKQDARFPELLKSRIYYLPVAIEFLLDKENVFNKQINNYVKRNRQGV